MSKEELRKELRKELAKKDAHINSNSKQISDLQQQLEEVGSFIKMSKQITRCVNSVPAGSRDEYTESTAIQEAGRATRG